MSSVADTRVGARRRSRALPGGKASPRSAARRRPFSGGIVWIVVIAVLLAGVVAVNVLVLQLNLRYDRLGRERAQLRAQIAQLQAELSSASANARIETLARDRLGLVRAAPDATTYVKLPPATR